MHTHSCYRVLDVRQGVATLEVCPRFIAGLGGFGPSAFPRGVDLRSRRLRFSSAVAFSVSVACQVGSCCRSRCCRRVDAASRGVAGLRFGNR